MLTQENILNLYKKYGVSASKRFGQNFLHNEEILKKIIESSDIEGKDVIEIGPGLGSLTLPMLKIAKSVTSYEIDLDMITVLEGEIKEDNFKLINGDFLKAELNWEGKRPIVANIPYNITSDILFTLFANRNKISTATLMMQKEVAERLIAPTGSKGYCKLTVSTQLFSSVEKITIVPPESFIPSPKVNSMVVKLNFKEDKYEDEKDLLWFIKMCFAMRRKTLFNNLRAFMSADVSKISINKLGLKESIRPQELTKKQFIDLYEITKENR